MIEKKTVHIYCYKLFWKIKSQNICIKLFDGTKFQAKSMNLSNTSFTMILNDTQIRLNANYRENVEKCGREKAIFISGFLSLIL